MSLETGSSEPTESVSTSEATPVESGSGYSVTDPGYDSTPVEPVENELEALKAENKTKKPSETLGDASEADSDTEETAKTPADDAVDSDGISDELLDRAFELGYTLDEIKGFRDETSLAKEVTRVEKLHQRLQERQGKSPAKEESAPTEEVKPEPDWDALIELGHDPDMIALQKQNWTEAQAAKALVQQLLQAEQARAYDAQCQRFDDALNNLGDEYKSILGTGRRGDLLKASPEHVANRQKVFTKMAILRNGYEQSGSEVPPEAELIQEAVQASFYKQAQEIARKALTKDIKKAGSQALSRPRSADGKPLAGQALATAKEAEFWRKHS
jgi:hypothetical protein